MTASLQIGSDDVQQLIRRIGIEGTWVLLEVDQMRADMVFDNLGHEALHGAACAGDQMHDLLASGLAGERPLDALHLASQAAHAGQQLLLIANRVAHELLWHTPLSYGRS